MDVNVKHLYVDLISSSQLKGSRNIYISLSLRAVNKHNDIFFF